MSVHLRRLAAGDGARVLGWRNSPEVARYMYNDHLIREAEHTAWLKAALTLSDCSHWIVELDSAPVGLASLTRIDRDSQRCDLALYLAEPAVRGRGVGQAIDYLLLRHAFEHLSVRKVWCEVLADNVAGQRVHERCGFIREALLREHVIKAGSPCDVVGLGLLRREWPAVNTALSARLGDGLSMEHAERPA